MQALSQSPWLILGIILSYFVMLMVVSYFTSGPDADNETFFTAKKSSPWYLVAIGMIGASLSGVTFISVPGWVGSSGFAYMQMVFGFLVGYFVIATVLMPIYYKYNLTSIYGYLEQRLGWFSYKTGSAFFLLSRVVGASLRLYLIAIVLDKFVLGPMGISFYLTVLLTIVLIWLYTFKGGIKTIVVTDVFQTVMMLTAVVLTIFGIGSAMNLSLGQLIDTVRASDYSNIWHFKEAWSDPNNFYKQFLSGALMALVMTGLDQDMMQKNLTCKTLKDAQKNMFSFSIILIFANLLFLSLGALLYIYASEMGIDIPERSDYLFPTFALEQLSPVVGVVFILGLIAAAYSSADSALTSLTTAVCVDFLGLEKSNDEGENKKTRFKVHLLVSFVLFAFIVLYNELNFTSEIIRKVFTVAGYTYGPLLGLFAFSILTRFGIKDKWVPLICIAAPIITYILDANSEAWFGGLKLGFLNLALNGLLTFLGLYLLRSEPQVR